MKRREAILALVTLAGATRLYSQPAFAARVGVIYHSEPYSPVVEGLREGLKQLGVQEGPDLVLEIRDAKADPKAIEDIARAFEREKVKLIYSVPMTTTAAVKRVTTEVPIVFCVGSDPQASGLVESYARPGGRLTGVHYLRTDLTAKRLELLHALVPGLRRVVIFYNPGNPVAQTSARMAREAGRKLGIQVIENEVSSISQLQAALDALRPEDADALLQTSDAMVTSQAQLIIERARAIKMPTMMFEQSMVERGALASYGVDTREVGRQSAKHVQRILSGAHPRDIPIENVTRLVFAFNRGTAQQIGLALPSAMLARFDRVIE
jgi:putative ABC transport system substrate-binding protein